MRICVVLLLVTLPLFAKSDVVVEAWARATPPGVSNAVIYGLFDNKGAEEMRVAEIKFAGAKHAMLPRTVV